MAKATQKMIRDSLELQLYMKDASLDHYKDLINDYMSMLKIKNKLIADINKRGVTFEGTSSTGYTMIKNNTSVKELVMVNRQMLSILKELGLTTSDASAGTTDEL